MFVEVSPTHHSEFSCIKYLCTRSGCGVASTPFSNVVHTHPPPFCHLSFCFVHTHPLSLLIRVCVRANFLCQNHRLSLSLAPIARELARAENLLRVSVDYSKHNSILYDSNSTCIRVQRSCQCTQSSIKKENLPCQNPAPTSQQAPNLYHQ